jgi:hypothetical protein
VAALAVRAVAGAMASGAFAVIVLALLAALKAIRATSESGSVVIAALRQVVHPATLTDWVQLAGIVAFALIGGLFVAAVSAARRGAGGALAGSDAASDPR